jgi:hypothetical protein
MDEKKKRNDRAKKLQERKNEEEFVIKAALRGSLNGSEEQKNAFQKVIKEWSDSYSQRVNFTSRALNLMLKECFNDIKNFKDVKLPLFLDQTFIRQTMLGVEDAHKPFQFLESFYEKHLNLLRQTKRFKGDRNIYSFGSKEVLTNIKTSLSYLFESRLKKYFRSVKDASGWENETLYVMMNKVMGTYLSEEVKEMGLDTKHSLLIQTVQEVRNILELEPNQLVNESWFKAKDNINLYKVIRLYAFILSRLPEGKLFDILPISRIRNHFITLDKSCLLDIFKDIKILSEKATVDLLTRDFFDSIFKFPKKHNFTGTIGSDGISVCFHFTRSKKQKLDKTAQETSKQRINKLFIDPKVRKLGCDPGRANIYTIVEEGKKTSWTLSRERYYSEAGMFKSRERTERWSSHIKDNLVALSKVSSKGLSLKTYNEYLEVFLDNYDILWEEYSKRRWANQRLRLYGGKKRCFSNFWNEVLGKENEREQAVIAFGSAKFASGGKGEVSVPTSRAFKECTKQKNLQVAVVDEFRTSKICHKTQTLLQLVKVQDAEQPLRGLLWCCSTNNVKQGFFVNRDVNAALNILKNATNRLEIFKRKPTKRLPKQTVVKVIKPLNKPQCIPDL